MSLEFVFNVNERELIISFDKIKDEEYCKVKIYENLNSEFRIRKKIGKFSKTHIEDIKDFIIVKLYESENIKFHYYTYNLNIIDMKRHHKHQMIQCIEKFCQEQNIKIIKENHEFLLNIVQNHEYTLKKSQNDTDKLRNLSLNDVKNFVDLLFTFLRDTVERKNNFESIETSTGLNKSF